MVLAGNKVKASDGLIEPDVQMFSSSGTWTKPVGAHKVRVRIVGVGGQAGGVAATGALQYAAAAGGGGGGYVEKWYDESDLNATEAVTIGSVGTAPTAGNNNGSSGGNCTFKGLTASGGSGGQGSAANASQVSSATAGALAAITSIPGAGGAATGGDINIPGESGQAGLVTAAEIRFGSWGGAACGSLGGPRTRQGTQSAGAAGVTGANYGSGAAGATNGASQSARAGAVGGGGFCIVETW